MSTSQEIAAEIQKRIDQFADEMETTLLGAAAIVEQDMRARAGLTDHSLKDLADLGHPYRQQTGILVNAGGNRQRWVGRESFFGVDKSGKWRAGILKVARAAREGILGHDIKLVHTQSGTLLSAIYTKLERTAAAIWVKVGVDPTIAPHVEYVVRGTSKMIPRDFIGASAVATRSAVMRMVRGGINAAARAIGAR